MENGKAAERILEILQAGPASEIDLRFASGLTKFKTTEILAELVASGRIAFTGQRQRNSRVFALAASAKARVTRG